ncbi:MAG: hypothetical protein ACI8V2_001835 [Candidatus Latescibacterota bacterium]|jgi:ectoine hydroxylase-related dioxygenase (phytanoyl-CoA dioxygenase family)
MAQEDLYQVSEEEKFVFDLDGYIVIKDVLSSDEVDELNAIADKKMAAQTGDGGYKNVRKPSTWGTPFQLLMDHPRVMPYLLEFLGPKVRIDHDYLIFMDKGAKRGSLHGGENGNEGDHWYKYRDGVIRTGLTVVTFFTAPAGAGDGGFSCIPGTHKTNFLKSIPKDVRSFERRPHYVRQPEVEAGDVLIFSEALVHGTMPWTADHQRRAFLYKYSPGHSAWSGGYYDLSEYDGLTQQQLRLMAPPSIGKRPDTVLLEEAV